MNELNNYKSRGARALVLLHEKHLRQNIEVWKEAKAAGIKLPETSDADYQSLEALLHHHLRAARSYMVWMCKHLDLPDPAIREVPKLENVEAEADDYLEHLLEGWRLPLANVPSDRLGPETYTSNWGVPYTIDGMLEHAVMHPIRHSFQLRELLMQQT